MSTTQTNFVLFVGARSAGMSGLFLKIEPGVGKSHNSPPSHNYNNSKVAEASIQGNFNKSKVIIEQKQEAATDYNEGQSGMKQ